MSSTRKFFISRSERYEEAISIYRDLRDEEKEDEIKRAKGLYCASKRIIGTSYHHSSIVAERA
jgi:hypothetical protein